MKKELIVGFRISLYDVTNPQKLVKILKPDNYKDAIWIPQTIFLCVLILVNYLNIKYYYLE